MMHSETDVLLGTIEDAEIGLVNGSNLHRTVHEVLDYSAKQPRNSVYLKYFWKILLVVACFYALPSIQFVVFQYNDPEVQCYFNYKCAHSALGFYAFNNIVSNLGYLLVGALFIACIYFTGPNPKSETGLHSDVSLYYAMGLSVMLEGVFSSLYHVCPSRLNFQFDATFMLIGSGLLFITLYQKRHATLTTGAFRAFGYFAFFIFMDFISLTAIPAAVFWVVVCLFFAYLSIVGSAHLYAQNRWQLDRGLVTRLYARIRNPSAIEDPSRFWCIGLANTLSWGLIITSAVPGALSGVSRSFSTLVLGLMILNFMIYLLYYISMKIKYGEKVFWWIWVMLVAIVVIWTLAIYTFEIAVTNKFLTFDESMALNKPCVLFGYFDSHDLWHFLSAFGLVLVMLLAYLIDVDLRDRDRATIVVF